MRNRPLIKLPTRMRCIHGPASYVETLLLSLQENTPIAQVQEFLRTFRGNEYINFFSYDYECDKYTLAFSNGI